jgi:hypothetical protein
LKKSIALFAGSQDSPPCLSDFVRTGSASSNYFLTNTGVRQGDILNPLLFTLVMDETLKECSNIKKYKLENLRLRPIVINVLAYADDIMLIADSAQKLQYNLNLSVSALEKRKLKVSLTKTKTMIISRDETRHEIRVRGQVLEQVREFKYPGTMISEDGKLNNEINFRILTAGRMFYSIKNKFLRKWKVTKETKMVVYKTIYSPVLTYGCESRALTTKLDSRLQSNEMRYLRSVAGKTRRDRMRNSTVRVGLNTEPVVARVRYFQLRRFGHIQRMQEGRYPKQALEARSEGRRPKGGRRVVWAETFCRC